MRTPSRFTLKHAQERASFCTYLSVCVLLFALGWMTYSEPAILLLSPIILTLGIIDSKKRKRHFTKLLANRCGESLCTFSRSFDHKSIDTLIILTVYEELQNQVDSFTADFPIMPSDDVFRDLLIDDEDFEIEIIEKIARLTGRSLERPEKNPYYTNLNVVRNLVYFFNNQPIINKSNEPLTR
ncbi:hypothetical protein NF212_06620 [Parasalinivibrio latis]|uniref:hypothetical protein n=1 Tax=Parasalinivibrio latis TaxID=2952610 RepID=UPI0030E20A5F